MWLLKDKKFIRIIISIIFGNLFAAYIIYEQHGYLQTKDIALLSIACVILIALSYFLIKKISR